jgi:hypothetical protein
VRDVLDRMVVRTMYMETVSGHTVFTLLFRR